MTAATARTGLEDDASAGTGDIVISIDAMSGERGVADVVRGMAMSLAKNPRLRYLVHGDGEVLMRAIAKDPALAARTEVRHAPSVVAMHEKPSRALRSAQGTSMWSALEVGEIRRVAGGDLLRQHRRADGAVDAGAEEGAGRRPAGNRRALAVVESLGLQRAARRRRRHPRRRRGSA